MLSVILKRIEVDSSDVYNSVSFDNMSILAHNRKIYFKERMSLVTKKWTFDQIIKGVIAQDNCLIVLKYYCSTQLMRQWLEQPGNIKVIFETASPSSFEVMLQNKAIVDSINNGIDEIVGSTIKPKNLRKLYESNVIIIPSKVLKRFAKTASVDLINLLQRLDHRM